MTRPTRNGSDWFHLYKGCNPNRQLDVKTLVGIEPTSTALQAVAWPSGPSVNVAFRSAKVRATEDLHF